MTRKRIRVVAAVVEKDGRYLITQRRPEAVLGLLWEFPGGKVEPGESDEEALRRELVVRLDADATVGRKIGEKHHAYDHYDIDMVMYEAKLDERRPLLVKRVNDFRWVASSEFERYRFTGADEATMDQLLDFHDDEE